MIKDMGGGWANLDGTVVTPIPGWTGELRFLETATRYYVGAGKGGGPVVIVYSRMTKQVIPPGEFLVGDAEDRGGVCFLRVQDDDIVLGPRAGKVLHVAFEVDYGGSWKLDICDRLQGLFDGLNVLVQDCRPVDATLGSYGTVAVCRDLPYYPGHPGFASSGSFWLPNDPYMPQMNFVLGSLDPYQTAANVAHEAGHGAGLQHDTVVGSLMSEVAVTPSSRFTAESKAVILGRTT